MRTLLRFLLWTTIIIAGIIGIARLTALRWIVIPEDDPVFSASVLPTLSAGDVILTWRLSRPVLGDLVLCPEPNYPERYVIGRIAGEAGDNVTIEGGVPVTNGQGYPSERACDPPTFTYPNPNDESEEITQSCRWKSISNHLHMVGDLGGQKFRPQPVSLDVTEGKLFLLSDNRLFPYDSRDFGLVDASTCKETVFARLVSKDGWMDSEGRLTYIH